jgi:hypothetical protein
MHIECCRKYALYYEHSIECSRNPYYDNSAELIKYDKFNEEFIRNGGYTGLCLNLIKFIFYAFVFSMLILNFIIPNM